jgi:hypothetical protein
MQPIVAFVPFMKPHKKHMEHFIEWYALNKEKHNLKRYRTFWQALHRAQQSALQIAKDCNASHILFTEDDHWGYPENGLEVLLEADKDVIGFPSYFKHYPWNLMAMKKSEPDKTLLKRENILTPATGAGIQRVDLITWAFTLVKMDVFDRMEEVGLRPFAQWGDTPTDSYFCQYCADLGIPVYAHMDYVIPHGDLPPGARHKARALHDQQHPEVVHTVLADDMGCEYGVLDHKPLSSFFFGREDHGHTDDDAGPPRNRRDADVDADAGASLHGEGAPRNGMGIHNRTPNAVFNYYGQAGNEARPDPDKPHDMRGPSRPLATAGD